jgi:HPt (histidine-containing phosphotransfer) domain-containing protein
MAESPSPAAPLFDLVALKRLRAEIDDPPGLVDDLLRQFVEELPVSLAGLRAATGEQVKRQAHKLKGTCQVLGVRRLADCCQALEHAPPADQPAVLANLEAVAADTLKAVPLG